MARLTSTLPIDKLQNTDFATLFEVPHVSLLEGPTIELRMNCWNTLVAPLLMLVMPLLEEGKQEVGYGGQSVAFNHILEELYRDRRLHSNSSV